MRGRMTWIAVLTSVCVMAMSLLFPAISLAGGSGSVTVSVKIGPCVSLSSRGEVRSNISVSAFADASFLTVMAR